MGLFMRRRPLLRAAAVGGGAYMMGKRRAEAETQEQAYAPAQPAQPPAAQPPAAQPGAGGMNADVISQLRDLGQLHDQGVLTDEEFAAQKAKLLG